MPEGFPNSFWRVNPLPSSGSLFLGSYTMTRGEHGDRFGIQPDGDYVIYPDGSGGPSGHNVVSELSNAGHIDGTPFTIRHLTSTPHDVNAPGGGLGIPIGNSIGAIDPISGDVYATAAHFGIGATRITFTPGNIGPSATSTVFVDNIGNGLIGQGLSRGITDLDFGPRTDLIPGNSLFFLDTYANRVYEVRQAQSATPVAVDDSYSVAEDSFFSPPVPGVLANDSDANCTVLNSVLVTGPTNGILTFPGLGAHGTFAYIPNPNFAGTDTFTYKATDGGSDSNVATVTITVTGVNDPPTASNSNFTANEDVTLNAAVSTADIDGDVLTVELISRVTAR